MRHAWAEPLQTCAAVSTPADHVPPPPARPSTAAAADRRLIIRPTPPLGVGRVLNGRSSPACRVVVMNHESRFPPARINQVARFQGLDRVPVEEAEAGTSYISGLDTIGIGVTSVTETRSACLAAGGRADAEHGLHGQRIAAGRTEGKFVTTARSATAWPGTAVNVRAVDKPATRTCSASSGRGNCTSPSCWKTCAVKASELAVGKPRVVYRTSTARNARPMKPPIDLEDAPRVA